MVELTIYITLFVLLLTFKLIWDWRAKNIHKRIINHTQSAIIDGVFYICGAALLWLGEWQIAIGMVICAIGLRWLLFDWLFNVINNLPWNHYGKSSKLDLFLAKCGKWHLLVKSIPLVIGVLIVVL